MHYRHIIHSFCILLTSGLCAIIAADVLGQTNTNGDFHLVMSDDFDDGVNRWTNSDSLQMSVTWDAMEGSPTSGSLRSTNLQLPPLTDGLLAIGTCMSTKPGERWHIETMVKKTGNLAGNCLAVVQVFDSTDCTGLGSGSGSNATRPPLDPDIWELRIGGGTAFPTSYSARALLIHHATLGAGIMSCNFDSVTVYNDRAPALTIPTLSTVGHLTLAVLLSLLGCALVWQRRH